MVLSLETKESGLVQPDDQSQIGSDLDQIQDSELEWLLGEYQDIFRNELPEGLPPKRAVDHEINTGSESPVERYCR
jgi:hypothetical protein